VPQSARLNESLSEAFANGAVLVSYEMDSSEIVQPTYQIKTNASVQRALVKVGSNYSFKLPFRDILFSPKYFTEAERKSQFCFDRYETADWYEETFDITLMQGLSFDDLPANVEFSYLDMQYKLEFQLKSPNQLTVNRKFICSKQRVSPDKFAELSEYALKVTEAENTHLALKKVK
jgi:hypothetical protein